MVIALKEMLSTYFDEFIIAAYVRDPFGYAASAAQQFIKSGSMSKDVFDNTLYGNKPGWGTVNPLYRNRTEKYIKVFERKNIKKDIIARDIGKIKNIIHRNDKKSWFTFAKYLRNRVIDRVGHR